MDNQAYLSDGPLIGVKDLQKKIEEVESKTSEEHIKSKGKVEDYESTLWKTRPFYQDDELISMLYDRCNSIHRDGHSDTISAKIISLLEGLYLL